MSETNDDPVVGHKTYRDANGTRHEPLRESEAKAIMARVEAATAKRKVDMPTEQDAIRALWSAHQRLKELGWRDGRYMPTTGERFATVQVAHPTDGERDLAALRHYDRTCPACNADGVAGTNNDQPKDKK